MGINDFEDEIAALKSWRNEYHPIFYVSNGDESWESALDLIKLIDIPSKNIWINFDDGGGSCFLSNLEAAPPAEKVTYVGLYVTESPNVENSEIYLLTDQDIECETCSGSDEECATCGGTGVEWLELDTTNDVPTDLFILTRIFKK